MLPFPLIAVCLALVAPSLQAHTQVPSYVKTCQRDQDNFSDCLLDSIQDIFPRLANGMPEFDIPSIDPLFVEESFYEFTTPLFTGKSSVKDAYVHGLSQAKFSNFKADISDPNKIVFEADMHVDMAVVEGKFKHHGKFMNLPLNGRGPFNITGTDVNINWKLSGSLYNKGDERYVKIKSFIITPKFGDMHIEAKNLIDGNPQLSEILVDMSNQYWRLGVDIGLPYTQQGWDKVFRPLPNRVFDKVPFDVLFPTSQ